MRLMRAYRRCLLLLTSLVIAACSDDDPCVESLTCIAPPAGFGFETFSEVSLTGEEIAKDDEFIASADAARINGASGPVFLKLTRSDKQVLYLGRFSRTLALKLHLPSADRRLTYEVYIAGYAVKGSIDR